MSVTETRNVYFKRSEDYIYKNICLIRQLTINKKKGCKNGSLYINGVHIHPTDETSDKLIWIMEEVRHRLRDSFTENSWIKLEDMLMFNSIQALAHYSAVPDNEFNNSIFTDGLTIQFRPNNKTELVEFFDGEEEVFMSNIRTQ